jgi:pyruvate/2-oxoglutarate dehydrogenase complex dihydrolipoamide acyltransferase (E2) component
MFGKRSDGDKIEDLSRLRAFMPFVSPRRNDSLVLYTTEIEVDEALTFIDRYNDGRDEDRRMTLFHLYLRALSIAYHERPGVNRFVAGGRLWQRNHVALSFSMKQEIEDGSPMRTIKRIFPKEESLEEMVDSILGRLRKRRGGEVTQSDREMNVALVFPPFLIRAGVWVLHKMNMLGALPKSMIDDDPLFTSVFIANLGSVGLDAGYHHLWEYGTCSAFGIIGKVHERADGKRVMNVQYTYDERVEDGLYAALTMAMIKEKLEKPDSLR